MSIKGSVIKVKRHVILLLPDQVIRKVKLKRYPGRNNSELLLLLLSRQVREKGID